MITGIHHISMKCGTEEEFRRAKDFYLNVLGLSVRREWAGGVMIDTGSGLIEIFSGGAGIRSKGAIRHVAFSSDDVDGVAEKVRNAGYDVFIPPKDILIPSDPAYPARMASTSRPVLRVARLM